MVMALVFTVSSPDLGLLAGLVLSRAGAGATRLRAADREAASALPSPRWCGTPSGGSGPGRGGGIKAGTVPELGHGGDWAVALPVPWLWEYGGGYDRSAH